MSGSSRPDSEVAETGLMNFPARWGVGIGWRPELAWLIENSRQVGFVEVIAESLPADEPIAEALVRLQQRGMPVIPHGISLSLGGAEPMDRNRLRCLASVAERLQAPLVSEHIAFVRGAGLEAGHLLPVARTRESLHVIVENIREAQKELPVPLAVENIAALFQWPDADFEEADFLNEILEQTGAWLLLDLANVHANALNHGGDPVQFLDRLPLERIAYVHVAGGVERAGTYHDTHAHPLSNAVIELARELCRRCVPSGILLERDDRFPQAEELEGELGALTEIYQSATVSQRNAFSRSHAHAD